MGSRGSRASAQRARETGVGTGACVGSEAGRQWGVEGPGRVPSARGRRESGLEAGCGVAGASRESGRKFLRGKKKQKRDSPGRTGGRGSGVGSKTWMQHRDFPGGHPSQYYSGPKALNFRVLMGSGVVALV
jgi:hypothetical protein